MFQFRLKKIVIKNNILNIENINQNQLNENIILLLIEFEQRVFSELKNHYDFNYIQSTIGANKLFNNLKKKISKNFYFEMITQHPNYTAAILTNRLIPNALKGLEVYALYFVDYLGKCWLNSQTKSKNLIDEINQLLNISEFKNDFEINIIEIYDSDSLKFKESQIGASSKRWKLIK